MDIKSKLVLNILARQCRDGNYRIIEVSDIIMSLPKHYRMDNEAVKHVFTYLERQDMISIKYDDDDTFCLAVLPYGFETYENNSNKKIKSKSKNWQILWCFLSSLIGTTLGILVSYFIIKFI